MREWLRTIIERIRGKPLNLVEIFKEHRVFITVEYQSVGKGGKVYGYRRNLWEVLPKKKPSIVTLESLQNYVAKLNEAHPQDGFYLEERKIGRRKFIVLTKRNPTPERPSVPIYFDLENQRFYIERESLNNLKLTNYIIMVTLGSLGVSQSKYVKCLGKVGDGSK